jgi:thiol-disulfide isomerase/thioredoxin
MMKSVWMTASAGLVLALGAAALPAQDKKEKEAPASRPATVKIGDALDGATKFKDLDGVEKTLADYKGKVVAVAFYSVTCPWMKAAEPKLKALHKSWEGKDVVFLAIDANKGEIGKDPYAGGEKPKETYADIRAHAKANDVKFTIIADHGNKLADVMQAKTTPHCFVFDKGGILRFAGGLDDDGKDAKGAAATQYFKDAVDAVLKGDKPKNESPRAYG